MKVTCIGGGKGLSVVLKGLSNCPNEFKISAITSMADDGGSTGILRKEFDVIPLGDLRKCLLALSGGDFLLRKIFSHRFNKGSWLSGHNLGNIILLALIEILGDEEKAIEEASRLLRVKGEIIPVTNEKTWLHAELENNKIICGESNIDVPKHNADVKIREVFLNPNVNASAKAVSAITNSDIIVIGPGDLYTSIVPNFLVNGIKKAMARSRAKKIYICNLMTKYGETNGFCVEDHVKIVEKYLEQEVDFVIYNNNVNIRKKILESYMEEKAFPVTPKGKLDSGKFFPFDLINNKLPLRHNPKKLAQAILEVSKIMDGIALYRFV